MAGMPNIIIDQQYSSLGIEITQAQMRITTPKPQMQVINEPPEMTVKTHTPKFKLNWKKVRSESGMKPPLDLARSIGSTGMQKADDGTKQTVQDGDFLKKTEIGGNRIAQLSRRKTIETAQKEINIGLMPKTSPEVEWEPGFVDVVWSRGNFKIEWSGEYMPNIIVDPMFSIEIYLREKPYIKITVEDGLSPYDSGVIVDKRL
ncbi:MAG: DUF6470 family protein [Oscillospiraceae bacterium]|nr:DUF6470 family protein [Oscillospiraceae bacterium]